MEQFKLRDIEQFDNDFVELIKDKIADEEGIPESDLIPNLVKDTENTEPEKAVQEESENISSVSPEESTPEYPVESSENGEKSFAEDILSNVNVRLENGTSDEVKKKVKVNGFFIGKIAALVLLALTVLLFMSGCFISIYLDNNGTSIGGYCFNTLSKDVEQLEISKGDLIISKKVDINSINSQDVISVPAAAGESGCDVQVVDRTYQNGSQEVIFTIGSEDSYGFQSSVDLDRCYGKVKRYIPAIGGIISFSMQNAILVCILFILLAALLCLLLMVLQKKITEIKRLS